MRGIRGAVISKNNSKDDILEATRSLLKALLNANPTLKSEDLASIFFTVTPDLNAEYPAHAARQLGWVDVPLLCAREIDVPGGMQKCIRILAMWNTGLSQTEITHVYLGDAAKLRPDIHIVRQAG
jgi:chorismate mutase